MDLEGHDTGDGGPAGPGAAMGSGDAAGRRVVDQGRPLEHEFGAGAARAVSGRSGDGICKINSGRGPGAGIPDEGFLETLRLALPAGRTSCIGASAGSPSPSAAGCAARCKEWALTTLGSGRLERVGIQKSAALDLFSEHCHRQADHARALWTLLVLSEWLDWAATETDSHAGDAARTPGEPPG